MSDFTIPRGPRPDATLALLADPYRFISRTCHSLQSPVFQTRIMLETTICMTGAAAAGLFYDESLFQRAGAMPGRIWKTLLGEGGVQGLDDAAHKHRKRMFMALMTGAGIADLRRQVLREWDVTSHGWRRGERVVLYDAVRAMLCRAACRWAGVPLAKGDIDRRTVDLTAMFQHAGSVGLAHFRARRARRRAERWAEDLIEGIRTGRVVADESSAAAEIAVHRDRAGHLLDRHTAAVEILNLLRPIVAVPVYIVFIALALHDHPEAAEDLRTGADPLPFV